MKNKIRDVRKRKGLTLHEVAARIRPEPTTAQTIGRLETGARNVTLDWLEKIAEALQCSAADLMEADAASAMPLVGTLAAGGELTPATGEYLSLHVPGKGAVAFKVGHATPGFEVGDTIVCLPVPAAEIPSFIGKECLVELEGGQRLYGRLLAGAEPGRYSFVGAGEAAAFVQNAAVRSVARRATLIRSY